VYDVTVKAGRVVSVGLRTASDANWPLFVLGMRDAVFTDFHFAWESHGITFAETDR
jgi:Ni,Fe-hydrogenase III large subunit